MPTLDDILISVGIRDNTGAPTARIERRMNSLNESGKALGKGLTKALSLGPALAPAVAAAGALASTVGGAAVAAGALYAAVVPQIGAVTDAAAAHDKYKEAVRQSGAESDEAKEALAEYKSQLDEMPAATQATAKEFIGLREDFSKWSDSLAGDTMPIFTKGLEILRMILPKLTPLVKGAAKIFGELMDRIKAKVSSKSFDDFMTRMTEWALGGLRKTIDGLVWLATTISGFVMSEGFKQFFAMGEGSGANLGEIFRKLAQFAAAFVEAAGPFAGLSFLALEVLADTLNAIPQWVLEILAPTLLAIAAAFRIYNIALAAYALYQSIANAAALAFPGTWIVLAIAAVILAVILLWKNWDKVTKFISQAWDWLVGKFWASWNWLVSNVFGPIGRFFTSTIPGWVSTGVQWIKDRWNGMISWFAGIPGRIAKAASGMWAFVTNGLKGALNSAVSIINDAIFFINDKLIANANRIPGVNIPWIPYVPYLAAGGVTTGPTMAMIGEGQEQEAVLPLSKLQAMIDFAGVNAVSGRGVEPAGQRVIWELRGGSRAFREFLQESVQNTTGGDIIKYVEG